MKLKIQIAVKRNDVWCKETHDDVIMKDGDLVQLMPSGETLHVGLIAWIRPVQVNGRGKVVSV